MDPSEVDCTSVPRYTRASEEDRLWRQASAHGIGRRRFLQLLAAGGAAAVVAACSGGPSPTSIIPATPDPGTMASAAWFKDPDPFIKHEGSLEGRLENIQGLITPNPLLFRAQQFRQCGSRLDGLEAQHRRGRRIFSAGTVLRPDSKYAFQDCGLLRRVCGQSTSDVRPGKRRGDYRYTVGEGRGGEW